MQVVGFHLVIQIAFYVVLTYCIEHWNETPIKMGLFCCIAYASYNS